MILGIKQFTSALAKVTAFAAGEKNVPGVLLDIKENSVDVCYSDGRKAVIEKIDAIVGEGDRQEKIVLNYQRLVDIISVCQPSGRIYTDNIEIVFEGDKTLKIKAEKKIPEYETPESEPTYKTVSVFEQSMTWVPAGADLKVSILSRMNYASIFEAENPDEWDTVSFREILDKTSTEKGRTVYISPKNNSAFVSNMTYFTCIPIEDGYTQPMVLNTAVAKAVYEILGKTVGQDKVNVSIVDKKYCSIHTNDGKVGIWTEMAEANQIHLTTLGRYQSKGYRNYQLTFIKEVLKNVVDAAMATDKADKTILKFGQSKLDEGSTELRITSSNSGASINNDYAVVCVGCLDPNNDIEKLELPISLKVLSDMLAKCDYDYVAIDIDVDETSAKLIRIAEIDLNSRAEEDNKAKEKLGLGADEPTPLEEQLNYRSNILVAKHYTISAK